MTSIRSILLLPDDNIGWHAIRQALGAMPEVRLTPTASAIGRAWELANVERPDVIVAASRLGDQSVFPLLGRLRRELPVTSFVVVSERHEPDELLRISSTGTASYLLWSDLASRDLTCTLVAAMSGRFIVLSNVVSAAHIAAERGRYASSGAVPPITVRERAVLRGLFEGLTQQQIALIEGISVSTVARAIQNLEDKLDASDRFVLGAKAAASGLVP